MFATTTRLKIATVLAALILTTANAQTALQPAITGDWTGALSAGGAQLHLIVHITATPDGVLHATLDSIDQAANGIPVTAVTLKDNTLTFEVPAVRGSYTGTVNSTATDIKGTWTQGQPLPLDLHKALLPSA